MAKFTEEMICKACLELLEENPLDKVTVKDIVVRCGINRNTFYYHYRDIYEVIEDIFRREQEKALKEQDENVTFYEVYRQSMDYFLKYRKAMRHIYNSRHKEILMNYFHGEVDAFIGRFVRKKTADRNLTTEDIEYINDFYGSVVFTNSINWIQNGMRSNGNIDMLMKRLSDSFERTIDIIIDQCEQNNYNH